MPERPRILQMGPDPEIGGGMAAAMRGILASPLSERYEFDVIPTYCTPAPLPRLGIFLLALLRLTAWSLRGRGRVVHIHATVRASTYRKAVCVLLAKALRRRVVLQMHSGAAEIATYRRHLDPLSLRLFRAAFAAADVVLAVSEASASVLRQAYGVDAVEVVPNVAPTVAAFERKEVGPTGPQALYLGGFANPAKGGEVILAALETAPAAVAGLRVTLAGPGELPAPAVDLLAARPTIGWAGWLGPEEKDELMRQAEIFVMPSNSEGLPMALLEAMAYGMAIVATTVGGIPELIEDGVNGLLVPPREPASLAAALARLAADAGLRDRLAAAARVRAESLDDVEIARRLERVYVAVG